MADTEKQTTPPNDSQIKKSAFSNFMSRLFGFRRKSGSAKDIEFVQVDADSNERIGQAFLNKATTNYPGMSEHLEKYYQSWLTDTTDKSAELLQRKERVDQLSYAVLNDPIIGRVVQLYADEATQFDEQSTVINIETPDPLMTRDMYKLLSDWGITQPRIRSTIENLATYGDAFWANKISERGVERIIPLKQLQVSDRIEFNPAKVAELKKKKTGAYYTFANNNYLIQKMLDSMDDSNNLADIFDTRLFGFVLDNDTIVPPWSITHFRIGNELGEFSPFGTSPILGALSSFKQTQSTIALQSLARVMSFPITIYKVKTSKETDEGRQFATVNAVREAYDNIGVTPKLGSSEVFTVNTRLWVPDGLVDVDVKKPEVETNNIGDIELYQRRTAIATGLPSEFWSDKGWYSFGTASKSLTQQYKPFGRKVFSIQNAFLETLADLFRVHFAITGQYDFRTPFTLSMKFPAQEVTEDVNNSRKNSIEIADAVLELIRTACGLDEDDGLPTDVVRDIVDKYTFLDPVDIMKWTRGAKAVSTAAALADTSGLSTSGGDLPDTDFGGDESAESAESAESDFIDEMDSMGDGGLFDTEESKKTSEQRLREAHIREAYKSKRDELYFTALKESAVDSFTRNGEHVRFFSSASPESSLMLEVLESESKQDRLREKLGIE